MALLQGNTYLKPVQVLDSNGNVIKADSVVKGEFVFGDLYKYYGDGGEVVWNEEANAFIVPLTEEDTFSLEGAVECQARLVLDDGSVSGSVPEGHYVYTSKSKTRLTEGGAGEESGEILTIKLLKELGTGGGIAEETDPTVPQFVKDITEEDIAKWNNGASQEQLNTAVANLVNSAPETLDTLGELATALEENKDVVDALNSAIGNKADKSDLTNYVKNTDVNPVLGITYGYASANKLNIMKASNKEIDDKESLYKPIVPATLDYAIKVGLTTNTETLTEEEKAQAQSWLGIDSLVGNINTALESVLGV